VTAMRSGRQGSRATSPLARTVTVAALTFSLLATWSTMAGATDEATEAAPTAGPATGSEATGARPACDSVADCLAQMTLDEKIGQMTQANHRALVSESDIADYTLGSLLAGGGGSPLTGNTPEDWADMVDDYQEAALSSRLGIPVIFGVDAVHGHNNVYGATIFPHNIGLGATRDPELVREIGAVTASEVYATGIPWSFSPCLCVATNAGGAPTSPSARTPPSLR
jgi:beta-glucosidase